MTNAPKPPSEELDKFLLRMPAGLRDRIKGAADRRKRSMNAEIVDTLEQQYPEPITVDEIITDIQETVRILKRFGGRTMLMHLADSLDDLMLRIANDTDLSEEERADARKHVDEHGKFVRFVPPDEEF